MEISICCQRGESSTWFEICFGISNDIPRWRLWPNQIVHQNWWFRDYMMGVLRRDDKTSTYILGISRSSYPLTRLILINVYRFTTSPLRAGTTAHFRYYTITWFIRFSHPCTLGLSINLAKHSGQYSQLVSDFRFVLIFDMVYRVEGDNPTGFPMRTDHLQMTGRAPKYRMRRGK